MSNPKPQRKAATGPDAATPVGPMTLTGLVRTTKGYALATAVIAADGTATVTLGNSQAAPWGKPHIAREHVAAATELARKL